MRVLSDSLSIAVYLSSRIAMHPVGLREAAVV